ncbi:MAG: hypothetical protein DHS20C13_08870 [Thermodesulfobacteriota bacterium]|nr:MAG: hypothetical protein DHS20C13_08870 [Thermodesulfobacteriota bacterium]
MNHFDKKEKIRYVAAQIYERFHDKNYWEGKELDLKELDKEVPNSIYTSSDVLNYSVPKSESYLDPGITLITRDLTSTPTLPEYYEITFLEASSEFIITIRHKPLFRTGIRMKGKLASLNQKLNVRKRIESNPSKGGKQNLIIINHSTDIEEISLQLGICLYRQGLTDKWVVFDLFQSLLRQQGQLYDLTDAYDLEKIFNLLIERFCLPNNAQSFRAYLKMLSKDLKRQINKNDIDMFGIPKSTIYRWIRENKLSVPKLNGYYEWSQINKSELIGLSNRRKSRGTITELIRLYSEKRNIKFESAKRTIKRWKRKGLSIRDIAERILDVSENVSK